MENLIIVEGPDGSGKSTLVKFLATHFGASTTHFGALLRLNKLFPEYMNAMLNRSTLSPKIFDRSWISEPIYGRVMRSDSCRISVGEQRMLERVALTRCVVVIYCLPPIGDCLDVYQGRRQKEYIDSDDKFLQIFEQYKEALSREQLPSVVFDYTTTCLHDILDIIEKIRPLKNEGPGAGHWNPGRSILIVGEKANCHVKYNLPFISDQGCSPWFAKQLAISGVPENRLYWVNALGPDGRKLKENFVRELKPKGIIALGKQAKTWCTDNGLHLEFTFKSTDHPAYWKRFKRKEYYPLISQLQEIDRDYKS